MGVLAAFGVGTNRQASIQHTNFDIVGSNTVQWFTNREVSCDGGVVRSGPRAFTVQNTDQL